VHGANLRKFAATLKARGDPFLDELVFRAVGGHPAALRACRRHRIVVGRGRRMSFRWGRSKTPNRPGPPWIGYAGR
jgi:hypothetical protein